MTLQPGHMAHALQQNGASERALAEILKLFAVGRVAKSRKLWSILAATGSQFGAHSGIHPTFGPPSFL